MTSEGTERTPLRGTPSGELPRTPVRTGAEAVALGADADTEADIAALFVAELDELALAFLASGIASRLCLLEPAVALAFGP